MILFYSYSHKDEALRDELETHLSILKRQRIIESWHDRRISPGSDWEVTLKAKLSNAKVILLLVSADFLASDYCYGQEVQKALELHESGAATVIPIILRACDWHSSPFGKIQALPKDGKPVTSWSNRDEVWADVARAIRSIVGSASSTSVALEKNDDKIWADIARDIISVVGNTSSASVAREKNALCPDISPTAHDSVYPTPRGDTAEEIVSRYTEMALRSAKEFIDDIKRERRAEILFLFGRKQEWLGLIETVCFLGVVVSVIFALGIVDTEGESVALIVIALGLFLLMRFVRRRRLAQEDINVLDNSAKHFSDETAPANTDAAPDG